MFMKKLRSLFIMLALLLGIHQAAAQGTTAFTYQGQLHDGGTNANGTYTMIFKLYDAVTSGNQVGSTITTSPTLANGLFTVNLDFGAGAFNGSARYLDITVTSGATTQELSPRVQVLADPYAQFAAVAATVTNGAIMNVQLAANAIATTNIQNNAITTNQIASGQVVKSLNCLSDAVSLAAGANVTLATNGNTLTIASSGGGGGSSLVAGNNVGFFTNSGIVQISSLVPNVQLFTGFNGGGSSGTFVVPTNVTRIAVEMWGAGGGGGLANGTNFGGGGGGSSYSSGVFTVTPGSSYSYSVPAATTGGQNGGAATFSGPGISMSAGGGFAGANATSTSNGAGGNAGTASGGNIVNASGTGGNNYGDGGGVFRGGGTSIAGLKTGVQTGSGGGTGPGSGGIGGNNNASANDGNSGAIFITY
jgi:hypothetical protein